MNNLQLKARKLAADLIIAGLNQGWQLSEDDNEDRLLDVEIRKIEKELRNKVKQNEQN